MRSPLRGEATAILKSAVRLEEKREGIQATASFSSYPHGFCNNIDNEQLNAVPYPQPEEADIRGGKGEVGDWRRNDHYPDRIASVTPAAVNAMPNKAATPSVSPNKGHAIKAVQGGIRKNRLETEAAAPRRINT